MTLSIAYIMGLYLVMIGWFVNSELERICKRESWLILRYYPGMSLEGLRKLAKASVRIAGLLADL
jgi:hypothetical protein